MKANIFLSFIGVALAALIGYLVFNTAQKTEHDIVYGIGSAICFVTTLIPAIGLHYDIGRIGANIRVLSVLFFVIFLISHFCFAAFGANLSYYISCNGIILMIYISIVYKLSKIKNV